MADEREIATAARLASATDDEGFPVAATWDAAPPIRFSTDWQGKNADPQRETEVRLLWSTEALHVLFLARYREISVFSDAEPNGRRDQLWERDVCEIFLQPDPKAYRRYKEFEVSPNGFWIDLDIGQAEKRDLGSGLRRRVNIDEGKKQWRALLALPMKDLTRKFDPAAEWHVNFYRVEGAREPRFYSAWRATHTPEPNFHVPEKFGRLLFDDAPGRSQ